MKWNQFVTVMGLALSLALFGCSSEEEADDTGSDTGTTDTGTDTSGDTSGDTGSDTGDDTSSAACPEPSGDGEFAVDLDANKCTVRLEEAPVGNLVADALMDHWECRGASPDLAVTNGGGLRTSDDLSPDGIYPAGAMTMAVAQGILAFGNFTCSIELSGAALLQVFESSAADLPEREGRFLQVSAGVAVTYDEANTGIEINDDTGEVISEGSRVTSLTINGEAVDPATTYTMIASDYVLESDGAFFGILSPFADTIVCEESIADFTEAHALYNYVSRNSPVSPTVGGRIEVLNHGANPDCD